MHYVISTTDRTRTPRGPAFTTTSKEKAIAVFLKAANNVAPGDIVTLVDPKGGGLFTFVSLTTEEQAKAAEQVIAAIGQQQAA